MVRQQTQKLFWHTKIEENTLYDGFKWFKLSMVRADKRNNLKNE